MKKTCGERAGASLALLFLLFFVFSVNPAQGASLPDVLGEPGGADGWAAGPPRATALDTASENLGVWQNRVYRRAAPIASVGVSLMEGKGFGTLYIPGSGDAAGLPDALFPASSSCETLKIGGKYAILESGGLTGQALSVALGKNRTLLAESAGLSAEELIAFAEKLVRALPAEANSELK
jgi:hypothetical protein